MKGIVYSTYLEVAKEQLYEIVEKYIRLGIEIDEVKKSSICYSFIFSNGDQWQARRGSESCRGLACNVAYIDRGLGKEAIQTRILPTVKAYPYQAIKYFGNPPEGEETIWNTN